MPGRSEPRGSLRGSRPRRSGRGARAAPWSAPPTAAWRSMRARPRRRRDPDLLASGAVARCRPRTRARATSHGRIEREQEANRAEVPDRARDPRGRKPVPPGRSSRLAEVVRGPAIARSTDPVAAELRDRRQGLLHLRGAKRGGDPRARAAGRTAREPDLAHRLGDRSVLGRVATRAIDLARSPRVGPRWRRTIARRTIEDDRGRALSRRVIEAHPA